MGAIAAVLFLLLGVLALIAIGSAFAFLVLAQRREWQLTADGRDVRLVVGAAARLLVDGEVVARAIPFGDLVLEQVVEHPIHGRRRFSAWVRYRWTGETEATLFVDGEPVGGDPPPGPAPVGGPAERSEPDDPRWGAVRPILLDLARSGEPRVRTAATDLARTLRELFARIARLEAVRAAHAALGDGSGVDHARAELDRRIAEALDLARELHVRALAGPVGGLEAETDLLAQLRAETEVDRLARERLARAARRERQ